VVKGRYDLGPYTPDPSGAGVVVDVGEGVKGVKSGNKVTGDCISFACANCKEGLLPSACLHFREVGFRPDSPVGMGEYLIIGEPFRHKFPDSWHFRGRGMGRTFFGQLLWHPGKTQVMSMQVTTWSSLALVRLVFPL
jgi:hypothetical protein